MKKGITSSSYLRPIPIKAKERRQKKKEISEEGFPSISSDPSRPVSHCWCPSLKERFFSLHLLGKGTNKSRSHGCPMVVEWITRREKGVDLRRDPLALQSSSVVAREVALVFPRWSFFLLWPDCQETQNGITVNEICCRWGVWLVGKSMRRNGNEKKGVVAFLTIGRSSTFGGVFFMETE